MQKFITVNFQLTPHIRRETHGGIEYAVAPCVAVQEDVLNGELLPAMEIAKSILAWNKVPLPISHPKENGKPISVNRADLLAQCVGHLSAVKFDGVSLHGELWVNVNKTRAQGGDALVALTRLEMGQPLEVSTAYEVHTPVMQHGVFNGKEYSVIQRDIQPDHLALLPNEIGACPWPQCGYPRVNHSHAKDVPMNFLQKVKAKLFGDFQANFEKAFAEVEAEEPLALPVTTNSTQSSSTVLPAPGPPGEPAVAPPSSPCTFKTNCDCPATEQHVNQEVRMDKKELVSNVLRIQKRPESERALYEALPDDVLTTLAVEPAPAPKPEPAPALPAFTTEQLQAALAAVMPKPDPDVVFMQSQFKAQADMQRKEWSALIVANSAYTAEDCAAKTPGDLYKLYQTLQASAQRANYSGRPFPQFTANEDEDTVPEPPSIMLAPVTSVSH